jgi:signal transduction histidine kinase
LEEAAGAFPSREFSLEKAYSEEAPSPEILADGEKLKQAFVNILRNAMEAVNPGGIIRITSRISTEGYWGVSIFNTGSFIPEEESQKIFDPFFTTKPRGTGLGLPIARALITLQGGELSVESIASKGVTFYIQFPLEV